MNFDNKQDYFIYSAIHLIAELRWLNTVDDILFRIDWKLQQYYCHVHLNALTDVHFFMNRDSTSYKNELLSTFLQPYKMTKKNAFDAYNYIIYIIYFYFFRYSTFLLQLLREAISFHDIRKQCPKWAWLNGCSFH